MNKETIDKLDKETIMLLQELSNELHEYIMNMLESLMPLAEFFIELQEELMKNDEIYMPIIILSEDAENDDN